MPLTRFKRLKIGTGLTGTDLGSGILQLTATGGTVAADTIWDSKGDLAVATGADAASKLVVGSNGQVLTADSTQTTGVKWAAVPAALRHLRAQQQGPMPGSVGSAGMYRIPFFAGASVTFTLTRASLHLEKVGTTSSVLVIEKSSTVDVFTAVTVATLTVSASSYSATDVTTSLGTVQSGNLIRFRWTSLGTGADSFHAQLEGTE